MKLYIIGNGFDISHGLPCRYSDFRVYLDEYKPDVIELLNKYYYTAEDSDLWSDFERSLEADIDYESMYTIIQENVPNFASDDFSDGDWYDAQIYIEDDCKELLTEIRVGFEEWIASLQTSEVGKRFNIDRGAYYLTFNYTELLEKTYGIPSSKILHIHNKVGEELIFGHGKDLADFNVKEALYGSEDAFLSEDEDGNITSSEVGHERFGENAVEVFFEKMAKDTNGCLQKHTQFFSYFPEVDQVIVMGHSYNEIDLPYFAKIATSISQDATWMLSYFSDQDKINAEELMEQINITSESYEFQHTSELLMEDPQLSLFEN